MKLAVLTTALFASMTIAVSAQRIDITTADNDMILKVGDNGRVYQTYLGEKLANPADGDIFDWPVRSGADGSVSRRGWEIYPGSGAEDYYEPAMAVTHPDGTLTTVLKYVSHEQTETPYGTTTVITLRDDRYPVAVKVHYEAYYKENVIKTWTEIVNEGKKPIDLWRYASAMIYFDSPAYYLTEFASDHGKEVQMRHEQLQYGKKVIDTKLGSRAAMFVQPFFEIGLGAPADENAGDVIMGTLAWTGNFSFMFEVDNVGNLRVLPSINPYASMWTLKGGETFETPEFIFTLSHKGTGQGSRNLHAWARNYQLKDGNGDRMTLLNNWENTYFNFDEQLLSQLMREASQLGVDMFLLDDGWFGNKYPRKDDKGGLGDWEATREKLPGGIKALTKAAAEAGVKFGIWIEPEMVNPRSELFEKHPDWAYTIPGRDTITYRNQLVLDLNNPAVQDHVFGVVDRILSENPDVAYFKWDCNSPITNIFSHYLGKQQQHLYIGHMRGLYNVLERIKAKYPDVPMMLCSGGGARCDYGALKYFTEFWCSDNTEPVERLFIQWGFSHFFPSKAMSAHVTDWNRVASVKFRTDVASMGKLGFDLGLANMSDADLWYVQHAIANWNRLKPVILDGDQYRLLSPYGNNHTATSYVTPDASHAVLFAYDIRPTYAEKTRKVKLQGLDPDKNYKITEINRMPLRDANGAFVDPATLDASADPWRWPEDGKVYSGDYLMKVGIDPFTTAQMNSRVVEIVAQ